MNDADNNEIEIDQGAGLGTVAAIIGALIAIRRKGRRLDIIHYATGYGIVFTLIGLFVTIFIHRAAVL